MKEKVLNIKGEETNQTVAEALSEIIGTQTKGNTVKLYGWYQQLKDKQSLSLDEADYEMLKGLIEQDERIFVYVKGQLLKAIKDAKQQ